MLKPPAALVISFGLFLISGLPGLGQSRWDIRPSNATGPLNAVVFGNGLFVAVGDNGAIMTSPSGDVWTQRTSGTTDRLPAIAFGNGRFVATRANRSIPAITSTDGINWTAITITDSNGAKAESGAWESIAFGGGRFMAVGTTSSVGSEVMKSADGISFQTVIPAKYPAPGGLSSALKSLIYCGGRFFGGDAGGGHYTTTNGIEWNSTWAGGSIVATDQISRIAINGPTSSGTTYPGFSIDAGHTFLAAELPRDRYESPVTPPASFIVATFTAMGYGAGGFVATDTKARIWTSERGEYWLPRGTFASGGEEIRSIAFDGIGRFAAVGSAPSSGSALIAVASADAPAPAPPGYTVYSLRDLTNGVFDGLPRAISNSGIIGGSVSQPNGHDAAAILRDGNVTIYPDTFYHLYPNYVTAVNDDGIAASEVLTSSFGNQTFGVALPSQAQTFPPPGTYNSTAPSINSTGWIVGTYYSDRSHPAIYRSNALTGERIDLGNLGLSKVQASSINDRGDIAGTYVYGFDSKNKYDQARAYRMGADGQFTPIPILGGDEVWDVVINSQGDVAGSSTLPSAPATIIPHAFVYRNGVTSDIDLFNSSSSTVSSINSNGDVVGQFTPANREVWQHLGGNAFLYRNGAFNDLNRLLDASGDGWLLYKATSINDKGWIVGQGWLHGDHLEPFLAIPNGGKPAGIQTRFVNVSTRLRTGTGDDVLIAGFILRGGPKRVILRAMGPGLANRGNPSASLPNLLADPTLELFNDRGERIGFNDNFSDLPYFPDQNEIGGYGMSPPYGGTVTADSVIAATLPEGNYTAVVRGKGGTSGTALVEVYNVDTDYSPSLVNISTRGPVGTGDDVMIAGFIIRGDRQRRILIRGMGPSLSGAGVANPVADPMLEIHDQNGQIAVNDNWRSDQETEIRAAGFAPGDEREAAIILSLWPGAYTAIVKGSGSMTGNALVEVYELPD